MRKNLSAVSALSSIALSVLSLSLSLNAAQADSGNNCQYRSPRPQAPQVSGLLGFVSQLCGGHGSQGGNSQGNNNGFGNPGEGGNGYNGGHVTETTVQCGQTITANTVIANDLNCPTTTGFALNIVGSGISVNGNGHQINAPLAAAGVYVQGSSVNVSGFVVNGVASGYGIFAYDSPGVAIIGNNTSSNNIGIMLYADNVAMKNAYVGQNESRSNALFGVRTGQSSPGSIVSPLIYQNDFSNSGSYAMYIQAASYELDGSACNRYYGSLDGIYLKDGNFYLHDFSMTSQNVQNAQIFGDTVASIQISNVDVSSNLPPQPSQQRMGVDLYCATQFTINGLTAKGNDVGLKLETQGGVSPNGTVSHCDFSKNTVSGVLVVSYDGTPYGRVTLSCDTFSEGSGAFNVFVEANTVVTLVET
jgi:hypothetical protein